VPRPGPITLHVLKPERPNGTPATGADDSTAVGAEGSDRKNRLVNDHTFSPGAFIRSRRAGAAAIRQRNHITESYLVRVH
jgi:hypothetical protein